MLAGPSARRAQAAVFAAAMVVAVGAAPVAQADDAALAGWLNDAIPLVNTVHVAENKLVAILAPPGDAPSAEAQIPRTSFDALKAPCDSLSSARAELQDLLPTPDQEMTAEVQQAVDDIETSAEECATVIGDRVTDLRAARSAILRPLVAATDHLAAADAILSKLATPE